MTGSNSYYQDGYKVSGAWPARNNSQGMQPNAAQQQAQQTVTPPSFASLTSGGNYFKFKQIGDKISGTVDKWDIEPYIPYGGTQQARSQSGKPIWQFKVVLTDTGLADDEDDDGTRTMYFKTYQVSRQITEALQAAGLDTTHAPAPGVGCEIAYVGDDRPIRPGFKGRKQYQFRFSARTAQSQTSAQTATTAPQTPAHPTPQQEQQVRQLSAQGQSAERIAGLTGLTVQQVDDIINPAF